MRTFIVIKNGAARVMRTYALGPSGRVITPDIEGTLPEITPAPDAAEVIAKWHSRHQAAVTASREISESDIPSDTTFKDAWEDDGAAITTNLDKARDIHADRVAVAQGREITRLTKEERRLRARGKATDANKAAGDRTVVEGADLDALATQIGNATNLTALKAIWPALVPRP